MTRTAFPDARVLDPALPGLVQALDPDAASAMLATHAAGPLQAEDLTLRSLRLVRHKPGRRAVVEYRITVRRRRGREDLALLAKVRASGADRATYGLIRELRGLGFSEREPHGVAVPEALALVPEADLWLQRRVPGPSVGTLARTPRAVEGAVRAAEAIAALHASGARAPRRHTLEDELAILGAALESAMVSQPRLRARIEQVFARCCALAEEAIPRRRAGIHRDFYQDHVLIDGGRTWLLDLDCFAEGEPALDAGNFVAHLVELGIRERGDADRYGEAAEAFVARCLALDPGLSREAVDTAATLALARHIGLSTRLPGRSRTTPALLALCERRLARTGGAR